MLRGGQDDLRLLCVAILLATATACVNIPDNYRPPIQRKPMAGPDTSQLKHFVSMSDPAAPAHILRDIAQHVDEGGWRWTGQRPMLRFVVKKKKNMRFVMDFTLPDFVIRQTGPLTISFLVNGKLLDKVRYDTEGGKQYVKPVEPSIFTASEDVVVTAELDKVWVSPEDGSKLGIILSRAGFLD